MTHLSPDANCVSDVVFAVGKLPDAVVDSDTALPGGKVLLCHLYPAQRAYSKTLEDKVRQHQVTRGLGSIDIRLLGTTWWQGQGLLSALYSLHCGGHPTQLANPLLLEDKVATICSYAILKNAGATFCLTM